MTPDSFEQHLNELGTNQGKASVSFDRIPGVIHNGVFWYFENAVTTTSIMLRAVRDQVQRFISFFAIAFTILCFTIWVLLTVSNHETVLLGTYWVQPKGSLLFFWLGLLSVLFLFYRVVSHGLALHELQAVEEGDALERADIPSLDGIERVKNTAPLLSNEAYAAVEEAYRLAESAGHASVSALHVFVGTFSTESAGLMFMRLGISFDQVKDAIRRKMMTFEQGESTFGVEAKEILAQAHFIALQQYRKKIGVIELFQASYEASEFAQELLYSVGIEKNQVMNVIAWIRINERLRERYNDSRKQSAFKPKKNMNRAYTAIATPFLDRVSVDLTRAAAEGHLPMLIGREREVQEMLRSIEGGRQSVVFVGSPGVGKESIIYGIAQRMAEERVPAILQDKRLVKIDLPLILSAQGGVGAEERLLKLLQEVGASGNIILYIEGIEQLVGQGTSVDLANVLAGELDKGYTFVLATASTTAYSQKVEQSILAQKLQKIRVEEPEQDDAIHVIESKMGRIENTNKVIFTYEALESLVQFSERYMHDAYLPEKAIRVAEEVALEVGRRPKEGTAWPRITKQDIAAIISEKTRVPVTEVTQDEGQKLLDLERVMHERVIGQDEAVNAVSSALRRARTDLRSNDRPMANFLFLGPTGVGKTELAKTTAEVFFGNEESMLRFDMSEYQDKGSIDRLIGGSGEGGLLTEAVRKQPFSLVLLDELEKAHPDILNVFLQVMDDGRLTDGLGRTIDFTNVILIATSNAGTQYIQDSVAQNIPMEQVKTHLMEEELRGVYRPEFLNRFDGVIVFKPLTQDDVIAIAFLMIAQVAARLEEKGISFRASDAAVHDLAKRGYDPKFGARPLRRVVQETVDNAIANILLKGEVGRRDTLVLEPGGEIRIERAQAL